MGMTAKNKLKQEKRERIITSFIRETYLCDDHTIDYSYLIKKLSLDLEEDGESNKQKEVDPLNQIEGLRKEIDECDKALVQIFQRRMELVMEILENKRKNRLPILHAQREQEIIQKALLNLNKGHYADEVENFLKGILKISRKLQSKKLFPYNIVLVGFMGAGKSTIGKDLASKLEMDYMDTDALVEEKMQMSIKDIFKNHGEAYFRKIEKNIVKEVSNNKNKIIFCGGGVVLDKENLDNLRKNGKILLLKAQPKVLYERIKQDNTRPVLKGQMSLEGIEELLNKRKEAYDTAADITIETDNQSIDEISSKIITQLYNTDTTL